MTMKRADTPPAPRSGRQGKDSGCPTAPARAALSLDDDGLARVAKALAHPARLALLRTLKATPCCCGHLVKDLASRNRSLAQSTVSQHLNVLVEAGLVTRTVCGVENTYTMNTHVLDEALAVLAGLSGTGEVRHKVPTPMAVKR